MTSSVRLGKRPAIFFKTDKQVKLKQAERRRRWAGGRAGSAGSRAAIVIGSNLLGCVYAQAASVDWQAWKRLRYTYMEAHCVLGVNLCASGGWGYWLCVSPTKRISQRRFCLFLLCSDKEKWKWKDRKGWRLRNMSKKLPLQWGDVSTRARLRLNNINTLTRGGRAWRFWRVCAVSGQSCQQHGQKRQCHFSAPGKGQRSSPEFPSLCPDNTPGFCTALHSRSAREIWERLQLFDVLVCTESVSAPAVKRVPDLLLNTLSWFVGSYLPLSSFSPADSCWWQGWSDVSWLWITLRQRTLINLLSFRDLFLSSRLPVRLGLICFCS